MWWLLSLVLVQNNLVFGQIEFRQHIEITFEIAGIFDKNALTQRLAFEDSIYQAHLNQQRLSPIVLYPAKSDSYSVWQALCSNDTMRPMAIFGPQHPVVDTIVKEQCYIAQVPFIQATWQPTDPDPLIFQPETWDTQYDTETEKPDELQEEEELVYKNISINFYPDSTEIAIAYSQLLKHYNWNNFAVLYEDEFGLVRVQKILAEHTQKYPVIMLKLDPHGDNKQIFKTLSRYQDVSRILLDCHVDRVQKHMNDAKDVNMADMYKHFIIVSFDTTVLTDVLRQYQCNTTWLSISDYDQLQNPQHFLAGRVAKWKSEKPSDESPPVTNFQTEALIIDDVAKHVIKAIEGVKDIERPTDFLCSSDGSPWSFGAQLQHSILTTKSRGVTGNIEFDEYGKRVNYTLFVNEIHVQNQKKIGRWESETPDEIISEGQQADVLGSHFTGKHFIVISKISKPFFSKKESLCPKNDVKCSNDNTEFEYEGFSVDLVREIFLYLKEKNYNFTYEFKVMNDLTVGAYDNKTKKWTGVIGHILHKEADLAVCDITITKEREKVVDFSVAFMDLGISILYLKEKKKSPGMFSFMYPYTFEVWIYTATAYCVVSIIMFFCSRLSPEDWENPQPCDKDPEELENIWSFKNCTWLTMGSIMTQGCDILPKAIGSRWVCGMWWFFAVIVCQTYIAQLSASMTDALETLPINNVEELANQNKILYGVIASGSTMDFFRTSKDKLYKKMYETMQANPAVLVETNDEGEKRVLKGKSRYAFFMESATIEYKLRRNCKLKKVGGNLDSKTYGIAMPANSPFRSLINRAILELRERTVVDSIKDTWWKEKYGAQECPQETDESGVEGDLELANLMGAFLVLIVGLVFCLFITAAEFMLEVHNIVVREGVSYKEVTIAELKSSLNVFQLLKPVLRNPSRAPSVASSDKSEKNERRAEVISNFMEFEKEAM